MNKIYKVVAFLPIITLIAVPILVGAQSERPVTDQAPIESLGEVETLLSQILNWVNTFFWIIAAIFILIAAFTYLTAGGNEEKVGKAKNMLIYAIIAIAIALFAGGIDNLVYNVLQGQ